MVQRVRTGRGVESGREASSDLDVSRLTASSALGVATFDELCAAGRRLELQIADLSQADEPTNAAMSTR